MIGDDNAMMEITEALVDDLLARGNLAQADIYCLSALQDNVGEEKSWIDRRLKIARALGLRQPNDSKRHRGGFLLIRSWGHGFWSDVSNVLIQLLLAEITARVPVVHWGANCLFGGAVGGDVFSSFFEPVSECTVDALASSRGHWFPPKWNRSNATGLGVSKMSGNWSRMNAIYLLNRTEEVVVSDFFTTLGQLMSWIPEDSEYIGMPAHELIRRLIRRYLRRRDDLVRVADEFTDRHFGDAPYIALHLRGTDKINEVTNLHEVHGWLLDQVEHVLAEQPDLGVFVLTDDLDCVRMAEARFAGRVVSRNVRRTSGTVGTHFFKDRSGGASLGREVVVDVGVALNAEYFVGMGSSNVAAFVAAMKAWPENRLCLIGPSQFYARNYFLNDW